MKNKISDVRNLLVQAMEDLSDRDATPEELAQTVERAKQLSSIASAYVQTVKVEIDAIRLMDETDRLPSSIEQPALIEYGKLRAVGGH